MEIAERVSVKSVPLVRGEKGTGPQQPQRPTDSLLGDDEGGRGFEIMANVIWEEIARPTMDELGNVVFAAGRPDEFRKV